MARYTLQAFKGDALQSPLNQGATSGTLTSGAFGSPTGPQLLVIDPETPAKREIISATISGTALTSITRGLDGTADVDHAANAPVIMAFVPSHYAQVATAAEDGWIPVAEVHTRVTDNQTTVPGDLTAKYRKGTKVKGTNGTVKYRVVASSSHSGGTTTINYIPTTNYVWASGAISNVSVSYIENPEGWPVEFNWMPTFTNFTLGNGTIDRAIYIPAVKSIFFEIFVTLGSTSSVSGSIRFTLPADVATIGRNVQAFHASVVKPGVINSSMSGVFFSATEGEIRPLVADTTYLHFVLDTTSTVPFTWASGDSWHARGTYRMA